VRLWGLLSIYNWGKRVYSSPPKDALARGVVYTQVASNLAYQYLENGAYLASKGVLGWSKEKQTRAWIWSSRFWMLHVGLDFVRLWREANLRTLKGKAKEGSDEDNKWISKWRWLSMQHGHLLHCIGVWKRDLLETFGWAYWAALQVWRDFESYGELLGICRWCERFRINIPTPIL
jgi:hypothetical protein